MSLLQLQLFNVFEVVVFKNIPLYFSTHFLKKADLGRWTEEVHITVYDFQE